MKSEPPEGSGMSTSVRAIRNSFFRVVILLLCASASTWAASQREQEPVFVLAFPEVTASEDGKAALPMLFTRRQGTPELSQLRVRLEYSRSALQYEKIEETNALQAAGIRVRAEESEPYDGQNVLEMQFSFSDSSQKIFPNGQLVTIYFQFRDPTARADVALKSALWIDGRQVTTEEATVGGALIKAPPIPVFLNCFFFSH